MNIKLALFAIHLRPYGLWHDALEGIIIRPLKSHNARGAINVKNRIRERIECLNRTVLDQ